MKTKINILLIVSLGLLVSITACAAFSDKEPIQGHVVEEGTNKPVPGAIVVARWKEGRSIYVDSQTVCVHVESTTTDAQGRYQIPRYKGDVPSHVDSYKPGYERSDTYYKTKAYLEHKDILKPFQGTIDERLKYLSRAAVSCSDKHDIEIKLLPLYKALYEEANSIAVTREEKIKVLHRLKSIEILEIGSTRAWKNFHRREQELK